MVVMKIQRENASEVYGHSTRLQKTLAKCWCCYYFYYHYTLVRKNLIFTIPWARLLTHVTAQGME